MKRHDGGSGSTEEPRESNRVDPPPRNSMLHQLGHNHLLQNRCQREESSIGPSTSGARNPFPSGGRHPRQRSLDRPRHRLSSIESSRPSDLDLPFVHFDGGLASCSSASSSAVGGHGVLRRPDSVITTSSVVSSCDNASQAGDSSAESSHGGPPSAYAITGLYGPSRSTRIQDANFHVLPPPGHVVLTKSHSTHSPKSELRPALVQDVKKHRRQVSYPVTFQAVVSAEDAGGTRQDSAPQRPADGGVNSSRPNVVSGHKRSHSCGHHRPVLHGHRRTGSSVIETLQTLRYASGGDQRQHNRHNHEQSLAQFLEVLKKEQQEKFEKQELHLMQDELEDLRDCGIGSCKPKALQNLANIKVFVFLLSVLVTLQQTLSSGYLNSVITTIEKRYEIPSSISGIIASMYEIGNVITVIFVSYLGSRRHIPVWIGMGVLVMGIGSITFSVPHFLMGPYRGPGYAGGNSTVENICSRKSPILEVVGQSTEGNLLDKLPGPIKSLTEGLSSLPLAPHNNQYNREDNCIEQADESSALPIFIFMVAQLLLGCGGSPLFTLGTTYIDNHVKRDSSSMYIGFMYSMSAFGPVCGFLLGAYLLSHHVDTFSSDVANVSYASSDRHWIGMWWGGFLICGASLVVIAFPFFLFPKELKKEKVKVYIDEKYHHATDPSIRPSKKDNTLKSNGSGASISRSSTLKSELRQPTTLAAKQASASEVNAEADRPEDTYGKDIKDIPRSTCKLLTIKIYLVTCLGACTELIIVSGFIVFLPKYLETQFNLSKSMASMFTGGIAIPGACIGIFLGGYLLKRLQLRPSGAVQLVLFFNVICLSCYAMLFFFGCDNIKMAGATMPYYANSDYSEPFQINLTASCNFGCSCDMNDVQPVCGANGLTYFSPCHAGCTGSTSDNYTNCACVVNDASQLMQNAGPLASAAGFGGRDHRPSSGSSNNGFAEVSLIPVATAGPCYANCQMVMPFMVLLFFMTLVVAVTQMPLLMVVLRSVEEEEKAFALGIQFVIFRLFGYIPSPILFGNVIDSTCMLWKSTCQGEAGGRCLMYDIEMFRYKFVGVCCGIKVLSFIIFVIDCWLIRKREKKEKKQSAMEVGEIVNSIISLDKLFDPDGPLWMQVVDIENPGAAGCAGQEKVGEDEPQAATRVVKATDAVDSKSDSLTTKVRHALVGLKSTQPATSSAI